MPDDEGPWIHALAYGVIRLRGRLDHVLDRTLRSGLGSVSPGLRDILRVGAYQLFYMGSVPAYAAVSQSVELARARGEAGRAGLVNGVLRSIQRVGMDPGLFPDPGSDPAGWSSSWGSHPSWLVGRWLERYGPDGTRRLVELDNEPPELYLRPLGVTVDEAVVRLEAAGVPAEAVGRGTGSVRVGSAAGDRVDPRTALDAVPSVIQDPAASLVAEYASPPPGARIADLCAAPGGKTLALAVGASGVVAADPSPARLSLLARAAARLEGAVSPVYTVVARGEIPPVAGADLVLADVPCSGTGTLRRHPDGRWRLGPEDVVRMTGIQLEILRGAAGAVRPGGVLVYSTCTLEPEENEEVVWRFLEENEDFRPEPPAGPVAEHVDGEGFLRVLPHETGFDGSFAARMRRAT